MPAANLRNSGKARSRRFDKLRFSPVISRSFAGLGTEIGFRTKKLLHLVDTFLGHAYISLSVVDVGGLSAPESWRQRFFCCASK